MVGITMNSVTKCPKSLFATSAQNLYSNHTSLCVVDSTTVNLASSSGSINTRSVAPTAVLMGRNSSMSQINQLNERSMSLKSIALIIKMDVSGWEN